MNPDLWRDVFDSARLPVWLELFAADPAQALDDLLWERAVVGEPRADLDQIDQVLYWAFKLGDAGEFRSTLDATVAGWLADNWHPAPEPTSAERHAIAIRRAFDLAAELHPAPLTRQVLFGRFSERGILSSLSSSAADPFGRYLNAIARHQETRDLESFWQLLSRLPEGTPWFHARYALVGLTEMPLAAQLDSDFREDVVSALLNAICGLTKRVIEGSLEFEVAKTESETLAAAIFAAYPFAAEWQAIVDDRLLVDPWLRPTLADVLPWAHVEDQHPSTAPTLLAVRSEASFVPRTVEIARQLESRVAGALDLSEKLLEEERAYALRTGDTRHLLISLKTFARSTWDYDATQALTWIRQGFSWDPSDSILWSSLVAATLRTSGPVLASRYGWEAIARFPDEGGAWSELGRALAQAGRGLTSVLVAEAAFARFDNPDFAARAAENLASAGLRTEAAQRYLDAIHDHGLHERYWRSFRRRVKDVEDDLERRRLVTLARIFEKERTELHGLTTGLDNIPQVDIDPSSLRWPLTRIDWSTASAETDENTMGLAASPTQALAEARLRRHFAGSRPEAAERSRLLDQSQTLIDAAADAHPTDIRPVVEDALTALSVGDDDRAQRTVLAVGAGNASIQYISARLEREQMRGRRVSEDQLVQLRLPWQVLRRVDSTMTPVSYLGEARACASVRDGAAPGDEAARGIGKLAHWLRANDRKDGRFEGEWAQRLSQKLGLVISHDKGVQFLAALDATAGYELDEAEEDFAARLADPVLYDPVLV